MSDSFFDALSQFLCDGEYVGRELMVSMIARYCELVHYSCSKGYIDPDRTDTYSIQLDDLDHLGDEISSAIYEFVEKTHPGHATNLF